MHGLDTIAYLNSRQAGKECAEARLVGDHDTADKIRPLRPVGVGMAFYEGYRYVRGDSDARS